MQAQRHTPLSLPALGAIRGVQTAPHLLLVHPLLLRPFPASTSSGHTSSASSSGNLPEALPLTCKTRNRLPEVTGSELGRS